MPEIKTSVLDRFTLVLATGFGSGYFPVASGTAGSAVGVAFFWLIHGLPWFVYLALTICVVVAGIPISTRAEKIFGEKDSGKIVIDEIAGQLIALFGAPFTFWPVVGGFLLFRLFDIWKPFRRVENLPGGLGVMLDDVLAGLCALAVLQTLLLIF